jgi:hypothetical protein
MTDTMAAKTVLICHLAKVWNLLVARACTKPNNWDTERGSLKPEHVDSEPANPVPIFYNSPPSFKHSFVCEQPDPYPN